MKPYNSHYRFGQGALNKIRNEAIFQRFLSLIPARDYDEFNGKGDYDTFVRTTSSSYDQFVVGLQKLLEKPQNRTIALKIAEKHAHSLGLKQFAQVADIAAGEVDLEEMIDSYSIQDSKRIKYGIAKYLRCKIPKNVEAHIEFYEGKKLLNHYKLDSNFTIAPSDIPSIRNGRIVVTVNDGNTKYKVEFTFRRLPLLDSDKLEGLKPEDKPFGLYLNPALVRN